MFCPFFYYYWWMPTLLGKRKLVVCVSFCNVCAVCRSLISLPLDVIGRQCSMILVLLGHLLNICLNFVLVVACD